MGGEGAGGSSCRVVNMVNIAVTSVLNNAQKIGLASGILAGYGYGEMDNKEQE